MELRTYILVLFLFFQTRQSQSKKILCLLGVGTETAHKWNTILLNEISAKGNDLTVLTPVVWNGETETNIELIQLENARKYLQTRPETGISNSNILRQSTLMAIINWYGEQMATCRGNLDSRALTKVLNMAVKEKRSFDMIILDVTYGLGCFLPLTDLFSGIPIVGITSSTLTPEILSINQNSILNAALDPFVLSDFGRNMNYWSRIYNTALYGFDYIYRQWVVKPILEGLWSHCTQDRDIYVSKTSNDLEKRLKVILANHHPSLHTLASLPFNVVPVPGLHLKARHNTTLATDVFKFQEHFSDGIVLLNLELLQLGELNEQVVLRAVRKFSNFGFIWKTDKNTKSMRNKPENLMLETKLENQEILEIFKADNRIKLVFTTPNVLSIQECIFHGVPMITLTSTPEQGYLVQRIEERGVAVNLQLSDLSELASILESTLINNTLQNNVLQLQKSFVNQQKFSLDTAVWWVEHLLTNPEANDYLLTASKTSTRLFPSTSLDVVLFFEVLIALCCVNAIWVFKQTVQSFKKMYKTRKGSGEKNEAKVKKPKKEKKSKTKIP